MAQTQSPRIKTKILIIGALIVAAFLVATVAICLAVVTSPPMEPISIPTVATG